MLIEQLKDLLLCFLVQIVFSVGIIVLFGYLISLCNKSFYANFEKNARKVCRLTGIIGTPVHELSHAGMALIFGHKIREIKCFSIDPESDVLGYVKHTYNKKNLWQNMGNFFIGTAPIVVISVLLYFLAVFLIPEFIKQASNNINVYKLIKDPILLPEFFLETIRLFIKASSAGLKWWIFLLAGMLFSLHMNLSKADIKNSVQGFFILILCVLFCDVLGMLVLKSEGIYRVTANLLRISAYLITILTLALVLSVASVLVSVIIMKISHRKKCI